MASHNGTDDTVFLSEHYIDLRMEYQLRMCVSKAMNELNVSASSP
jgi:hypothetical protein